jgi:hypothetical protein
MKRFWHCICVLAVGVSAFSFFTACDTKVTEKTEVKDRLGGGEKVEKTRVIETDDKIRVEKEKTKIDRDGEIEKQEKSVTEGEKVR